MQMTHYNTTIDDITSVSAVVAAKAIAEWAEHLEVAVEGEEMCPPCARLALRNIERLTRDTDKLLFGGGE